MRSAVIVVMGVAGAGKTLIGSQLADRLAGSFVDADTFHGANNKEKMSAGIPLTDDDRLPWLEAMSDAIASWLADGGVHILACSALKRSYRQILQGNRDDVHFVYLRVGRQVAADRTNSRVGHYMKSNMVDSQFATLEEPDEASAIHVDAEQPPANILDEICRQLAAV
jgi:gluconokinase